MYYTQTNGHSSSLHFAFKTTFLIEIRQYMYVYVLVLTFFLKCKALRNVHHYFDLYDLISDYLNMYYQLFFTIHPIFERSDLTTCNGRAKEDRKNWYTETDMSVVYSSADFPFFHIQFSYNSSSPMQCSHGCHQQLPELFSSSSFLPPSYLSQHRHIAFYDLQPRLADK